VTRAPADVLAALDAPRLVVVGDLMIDRYVTGVVERISPEAPIQVLRAESESERLGGAASVAADVAALGARAVLVGVVGADAAAQRLPDLARSMGVELEAVPEAGRRTTIKTRHLARSHAGSQQVLRVDSETAVPLAPAAEQALLARLAAVLPGAQGILVSDYAKGLLTPKVLAALVAHGRQARIPVVVDPKGDRFERYRGATCITPNRSEAHRATGVEIRDAAGAEAAAARLLADTGVAFVLVTLDRDGMYLKAGPAQGVHIATTPREVFDVTGAGDMVLAVLAMGLASGATPLEAATLANVAAGLEVEHVGVVPISRSEIAARLASQGRGGSKQLDRGDVAAMVVRERAAGRRIVFTNGCFDVLHAGHVRFLTAARAHGAVLVVGLNGDASVRRLKGPERPVNPVSDRVEVLSALAMVDHVVVFDEDTPEALIREVEPDVLAKGADWAEKGVVGRESVEARGGKVVLLPLLEGRSTTRTVERLRDRLA
jgi:D-beta-D-heptose 7-phosphate kinase / D-beta-D-heptose 1-phosphate adenosyltransferase